MKCTQQSMKIPYYTLGLGFSLHFWLTRHRIDMIDDEICRLIQKRMELSEKAHHYRTNVLYDDKFREEYVVDRLKKKNMIHDNIVDDVWRSLVKHECTQNKKTS